MDVVGDIRATGGVYDGGTSGSADGTACAKPDFVFDDGCEVRSTDSMEEFLKREGRLPRRTSVQQEKRERGPAVNRTWMAFETAENLQLQPVALNEALEDQQIEIEGLRKELRELRAK